MPNPLLVPTTTGYGAHFTPFQYTSVCFDFHGCSTVDLQSLSLSKEILTFEHLWSVGWRLRYNIYIRSAASESSQSLPSLQKQLSLKQKILPCFNVYIGPAASELV